MLRVAVVGLGFMGRMHLRCYRQIDDVEVTAVCERDTGRLAGQVTGNIAGAEEALNLDGVRVYDDFKKMLAEEELDAISIALPTYMHRQFTVEALEAGVAVLCEKPMAVTLADCEAMM